jgi:DNA-binding transcriptional ArsR family regulator
VRDVIFDQPDIFGYSNVHAFTALPDALPGAAMTDSHDFYCLHSEMCKTLANEKRQRILDAIRDTELSVSDLRARTGIPQATLSQHLAILRAKGVVNSRREGSHVHYSVANPKIIQAFDLISEVMVEQMAVRKGTIDGALGD